MAYTTTLLHTSTTNHEEAGHHAMDLAKVAQARYPVPLSFVIPCSLNDAFLVESGIKVRLETIYSRYPQTVDGYARAYKEVKELFKQINFSQPLKEELLEAYESLAISSSQSGASALVNDEESPAVILIPSLTYRLPEERLEGTQVNVVGEEAFLHAIKMVWASAYLPEQVLGRQHYDIRSFSMGIVVEQQQPVDASAFGSYRAAAEFSITVHSYAGCIDIIGEVTKDEHLLSAEHLQVHGRTIHDQQFKLIPGKPGLLEQHALGEQGTKQVLNDRQVLEIARLTKRVHVILGQDVTTHCSVKDETVSIMLVLRENNTGLTRIVEESPEPESRVEDEYIPVEEVAAEPVPVEEVPVVITKEIPLETENVSEQAENVSEQEPLQEEAVPPVEQYETSAPKTTLVEEAPVTKEETLFDMVQQESTPEPVAQEDSPGAAFIDEVMTEAEKVFVELYKQRFEGEPDDYDSLVHALREADALPVVDEDLQSLQSWHERIGAGEQPTDTAIGLAWRVLQQLFR